MSDLQFPLKIPDILDILPHRYPFLLIDQVTYADDVKAYGYKNVSFNEPFFQGHFPGAPIMPGVLIVEALAQLGCCQLLLSSERRGQIGLFAGIDKMKFRTPVVPGDKLEMEAYLLRMKGTVGKCSVKASVNGQVAAEGELMFALVNKETLS